MNTHVLTIVSFSDAAGLVATSLKWLPFLNALGEMVKGGEQGCPRKQDKFGSGNSAEDQPLGRNASFGFSAFPGLY